MKRGSLVFACLLLALASGAGGYVWWKDPFRAEPAYRLSKIERGSITAAVSATGTLNPVVSVQVGSQVSGQIQNIYVDFNSAVKRGQLIARIDPQSFTLKVNQALADVEAARATALTQKANLAALNADVARTRAMLREAEREYSRNQMLHEKNFVSGAVRDKALAMLEVAREHLKAAQAQLAIGESQIRNGEAVVKQREAQLGHARVDLERTEIRAPVNGIVVKKSVEPGQTVAASLQAPELFVIAQDLRQMQVEASIDESEVGRIRVGQQATFTVDSFPGRSFRGSVRQMRKAAQVVQNVVTYIAVIDAANPELELFPGMTANVKVVIDTREDVLKVPNAALRFRPPGISDLPDRPGARQRVQAGDDGKHEDGRAFVDRLSKELQLSDAQREKVGSIVAETTAKMHEVVTDDAIARRRLIDRIRVTSRERIAESLTSEQRARYEAIGGRRSGGSTGRVWLVRHGEPDARPVSVGLGLTDGSHTEIVSGDLAEGADVVVGTSSERNPQAPAGKGFRFGV